MNVCNCNIMNFRDGYDDIGNDMKNLPITKTKLLDKNNKFQYF